MNRYIGYTHLIPCNKIILLIWKKIFCKRGWHLWDEVSSVDDHYLYCDACETTVNIK